MKFLKWKDDKFFSKNGSILPYDKLEHLFREAIISIILAYFGVTLIASWILVQAFGIAWEIKDGLIPYKDDLIEGFSWKDLIANNVGLIVGNLIRIFI